MNATRLFVLISVGLGLVTLWLNAQVIQHTLDYKNTKVSFADEVNFRARVLDPDEWTDGKGAKARAEKAEALITEFDQSKTQAQFWGWIVLSVMGLYFLLCLIWYFTKKNEPILLVGLFTLSVLCLEVGLFAPMLEIAAYEQEVDLGDLPVKANVFGRTVELTIDQVFEGDMYFYYQSKSVVELIQTLFEQNNYVVGISLTVFSILFPVSKLLLIIGLLVIPGLWKSKFISNFVAYSGKWSMADVFVVAMFLGYLALDNMQVGIPTESKILIGLYFFLAYCILSIAASIVLDHLYKSGKLAVRP
ncbi:MAG: paraquat-inducible protein A [Bacteroidota bacterium]